MIEGIAFKITNRRWLFRDDIFQAVKKLKTLGSGYRVLDLGGQRLVQVGAVVCLLLNYPRLTCLRLQSVPLELSQDHSTVLKSSQVSPPGVPESLLRRCLAVLFNH